MDVGRVVELARYPVKSMRGETLAWAEVAGDGFVEGDWIGRELRVGDVARLV